MRQQIFGVRPRAAAAAPVAVFSESFTSAEQTITSGGQLTIAHGLGVVPSLVQARLICNTAELGYAVNDEAMAPLTAQSDSAVDNMGLSVVVDATNVVIRLGSLVTTSIHILNKTTGANSAATNANWKLVVRVWK